MEQKMEAGIFPKRYKLWEITLRKLCGLFGLITEINKDNKD